MNPAKTATAVQELADDVEITTSNGDEQDILEEGPYRARLINFKVEETPDWKMAKNRERNPDREPDPRQYAWYFQIVEPEYEGHTIADWTTRSFHEKSNGGKYAAYLQGKTKLDGSEPIRSTAGLVGRELMLYITQSKDKNYCSAAKSFPVKKAGKRSLVDPNVDALPIDEDELPFPSGDSSAASDKQVKAIYAIGRAAKRLSEGQVDERCVDIFGVRPTELTKSEASQFIDMLKGDAAA